MPFVICTLHLFSDRAFVNLFLDLSIHLVLFGNNSWEHVPGRVVD